MTTSPLYTNPSSIFELNRQLVVSNHPSEVCMSCPIPGGHEFDLMSTVMHPNFANNKSSHLRLPCSSTLALQGLGFDTSALYYSHPLIMPGLPSPSDVSSPLLTPGLLTHSLPNMAHHPYGLRYPGMDVGGGPIGKTATRETTGPLKAWLGKHKKNPYPTKAEKIMLSIITKMTLTQVSTWFANARRRLKKERKHPDSTGFGSNSDKDKDDDDDDNNDDDEEDNDIDVDDSSHACKEDNNKHDNDCDQGINDNDDDQLTMKGSSWKSTAFATYDSKDLGLHNPHVSYRKQITDESSWLSHPHRLHTAHPQDTPFKWTPSVTAGFVHSSFPSSNTHDVQSRSFLETQHFATKIPKMSPSPFMLCPDVGGNQSNDILDLSSKKDTQSCDDNTASVGNVNQNHHKSNSSPMPNLSPGTTSPSSPSSSSSTFLSKPSPSNTDLESKHSSHLQANNKSRIWSISEIIKEESKDEDSAKKPTNKAICDFS